MNFGHSAWLFESRDDPPSNESSHVRKDLLSTAILLLGQKREEVLTAYELNSIQLGRNCMYIYICIYIHIYIQIKIYIYIHITDQHKHIYTYWIYIDNPQYILHISMVLRQPRTDFKSWYYQNLMVRGLGNLPACPADSWFYSQGGRNSGIGHLLMMTFPLPPNPPSCRRRPPQENDINPETSLYHLRSSRWQMAAQKKARKYLKP